MNERAANALYEAERKGVKQIVGSLHDPEGGRCAMGVISEALIGQPVFWFAEGGSRRLLDLAGMTTDEWNQVVALNNVEGRTFSEIARKLGPDSA